MKRFSLIGVVLALILSVLPSCATPDPVESNVNELALVADGATEYEIVYPQSGPSWQRKLATQLRDTIKKATGTELSLRMETEQEPASARSILIRSASNALYRGGYDVATSGEQLIFSCGSQTGAYFALCAFVSAQFGVDLEAGESVTRGTGNLSVKKDLHLTKTVGAPQFPYLDESAESLAISFDWNDYISHRMAIKWREQIYYQTGTRLDLESFVSSVDELDPNSAYLVVMQNDALQNGDWRMYARDDRVYLEAGDYNGYVAALRDFGEQRLHEWGFYTLGKDWSESGNYLATLAQYEDTSRYAYIRQGEYRILFHNVLFHNGTGTRPNQKNDVPVKERNPLQAALVGVYRPDVLALQEVAKSKRQGAGEENLITLLNALGYEETIDPRVQNSKPVEEGGWGVVGERVTDENGNVFYTNYNMDPLLYNTATTRCIESDYHWFSHYPDDPALGLSAGEFSTKAATWGVFESILTGERYIVISTHVNGQDRSVQVEQARELARLVDELVAKYDCPAFLGGDFNGKVEHPYYEYLTEETDLVSLQDRDVAAVTSKLCTTHGYPCYNEALGIMMEGDGSVTEIRDRADSIDKVFATNLNTAEVALFGVIADECSLSSSDHLPMLVDFSIHTTN